MRLESGRARLPVSPGPHHLAARAAQFPGVAPSGLHTSPSSAGSTAYLQPRIGAARPRAGTCPAQQSSLGPIQPWPPHHRQQLRRAPTKGTSSAGTVLLLNGPEQPPPKGHHVSTRAQLGHTQSDAGQARPGPCASQQPAPSAHLSHMLGCLSLLQSSSSFAAAFPRGRLDSRPPLMPHAAPHSAATLLRSPAQAARDPVSAAESWSKAAQPRQAQVRPLAEMFRPSAPSDYAG
ncbi:hypothetical protein NDU88_009213 [Pleurodeles waltl]|uniref:Uncharacterized protein n=1 Tax=Pleurodeles waltl TaxID=8319 RepID=A0AAV7PRK7_PLEWA|nr:hypothetical protein NDU88_009213 [Pleurodeles waltl]